MFKPLIILGLAVAFTGCATTSSTTASKANDEQKVAEKEDTKKKIICKRQARVGSHFKKTQCWTAEEYAAKQERDRQEVQKIQNNSSGVSAPEGR